MWDSRVLSPRLSLTRRTSLGSFLIPVTPEVGIIPLRLTDAAIEVWGNNVPCSRSPSGHRAQPRLKPRPVCVFPGSREPHPLLPLPLSRDPEGPPRVSLGGPGFGLSLELQACSMDGAGAQWFLHFCIHRRMPRVWGHPKARPLLTFYYVLPGKAPLRLGSEKQVTVCAVFQAVFGEDVYDAMLGEKSRSVRATWSLIPLWG